MSGRTLVLVNGAADAGSPDASRDVVVLDTWWARGADDPAALVPAGPTIRTVLERRNLVDESLDLLDAWAAAARLADQFLVDGFTWWFRVRMAVRWDLHELLLWRHVLGILAPPGRYARLIVPGNRAALVSAARAFARTPGAPAITMSGARSTRAPGLQPILARLRGRARRGGRRLLALRPPIRRRARVLDARLRDLAARPPRVLAVAWAGAFQVVEDGGGRRFLDPHLALVLDRLAGAGWPVATLASGLDHLRAKDWPLIDGDERLLPSSIIEDRWQRPADDAVDSGAVGAGVRAAEAVPLDVDGCDLGPAMAAAVQRYTGRWLNRERQWSRWAERFLSEVRPGALYLDREGTRTPWIVAAHRLGIPIVAVQHGMIYSRNPEYCHPRHAGMVRCDRTCVFGSYERDILVEQGGYAPAEVSVTGSPRAYPDPAAVLESPAGRNAVRRELGIDVGDRMLVVSVAHNTVGEIYSASMIERLLDGPLPGIHLVIKLHPQDRGGPGYARLLANLASARGYEPPRLTVVRDFDLYRLLQAADAHLGQHSTVLTDAVVAGIPNMIEVGQADADPLGYAEAGVAVPVGSIEDVRAFMADPRPPTPENRTRFLDAHFRRGDAAGRIAAVIEAAIAAATAEPASATGLR